MLSSTVITAHLPPRGSEFLSRELLKLSDFPCSARFLGQLTDVPVLTGRLDRQIQPLTTPGGKPASSSASTIT
jgi:hypothetical protein